ncbi:MULTISPECIES: 2-dehydro-3-deoxy-6-phosphogalactonate aldolase [unclassified Roseitalea]|uniref:2-dehydro-3-deoxy-6-phosphogalactonate aldolase n=1 Tax=unclassified Roseitalea TaxID=2639107 RepID=UPI00273F6AF0|nr:MULTISPECIES: 2-dehydro-3-deoxy-6-phosphogalactonate aldolase [unclassified Roseitalea]
MGRPRTPTAPWPHLSRGLIAILRGLTPDAAPAIADALVEAGFEAIEVPLNSPEPFASIETIARRHGDTVLVGAGTVLDPHDVDRLADCGGRLLVSPNIDAAVMARAGARGLVTMPGVFTATEALAALSHGASALKFFPASVLGPAGIKAVMAILPKGCVVGAVGGVSDADFAAYAAVGVRTFGLGSSLFAPGMEAGEVAERARRAVAALDAIAP